MYVCVLLFFQYLGSSQIMSPQSPNKAVRMEQAQEALGRIKVKLESILCKWLSLWYFDLKGHSQLVHMRIRYHFIGNLYITLHLKKRDLRRKWEAHVSKPRRIEVLPSQNSA